MHLKQGKLTKYYVLAACGVVISLMQITLFMFILKTVNQQAIKKPFDLITQLNQDGIAIPQDFDCKPVIAYSVSNQTRQRTILEFDISNPIAQVINIDKDTQILYLLFPEYQAVKVVTALDGMASTDTFIINLEELDAFKNQNALATSVVGGTLRYRVYKFDCPFEQSKALCFTVYGEFDLPSVTVSSEVLGQYNIALNIE